MATSAKMNLQTIEPLLHPLVYVRGYAMSEVERDETSADPFCGFNLGSTVYRASYDKKKKADKFIFESPVVRLISDFGYADVYESGLDIMDPGWVGKIPYRSIVVYRYYDEGSALLGEGDTSPIEEYARGLGALIARIRDLAVDENGKGIADFKCYLVAHSMGGLVCRAFLQNPALGDATVRGWVDKVFTYATPHNGIEMAGLNVPSWLALADMANFNRARIADYLALTTDPEYLAGKHKKEERVDLLRNFPPERFFCMVGTNRADYNVAAGLSRTFAGHGSDGLVKVDNAVLYGKNSQGESVPCPRAYTFRSHSGYFGIVNSEEAFQNLTRFLFGDLRVDIWFEVESVVLPKSLQNREGVQAGYYFELLAAPRGKRWQLTRRTAVEDSVVLRTHDQLVRGEKRMVYLSTVFLARWAKAEGSDDTLSYAVTPSIGVQEYVVSGMLFDSHYEGMKLFSDTVVVTITPGVQVDWHWGEDAASGRHTFTPGEQAELQAGRAVTLLVPIPTVAGKAPGVTGNLRFVATPWNRW